MSILFVDDDSLVCGLVCRYLTSLGYVAVGVDDPVRALEIASTMGGLIEAVITDIQMPGMTGPEMWQQMKNVVSPGCRLIFMTGALDPLLRPTTDEVLLKPFSREELKGRLSRARL